MRGCSRFLFRVNAFAYLAQNIFDFSIGHNLRLLTHSVCHSSAGSAGILPAVRA
jgi:hypothetical protein